MSGWEGEVRGRIQFHKRDARKSHFNQCINLPRKGGEGWGDGKGVEEEIQSGVKWAGCEKGAPVDRSLEKAPHSPAGFCSALVLLVQCWWSGWPPSPPPPQNPPYVPPNCPPCAGATLTAWTPDLSIWKPYQGACSWLSSTAGALLDWADSLHLHC